MIKMNSSGDEYFGVKLNDAKEMIANMCAQVASWNIVAKNMD